MGDVIRFIPMSERERIRLIREARAIYESVFPPVDPAGKRREIPPAGHARSGADPYRSDRVLS
jgi:hypothetical protein